MGAKGNKPKDGKVPSQGEVTAKRKKKKKSSMVYVLRSKCVYRTP